MPAMKVLCIFAPIMLAAAQLLSGEINPGEVAAGFEYRRDIVDYEEREKDFFREKITISLGGMSRFHLACIQSDGMDPRHTWYLKLHDFSPAVKFIVGDFQGGFGAGLLMGKKKYLSSDPFAPPPGISQAQGGPFSGSGSGNPRYSFSGMAGTFQSSGRDAKFFLNPFYSQRRRYVTAEDRDSRLAGRSLDAVNQRVSREGTFTDPVIIMDRGFMAGMQYLELFTVHVYYFQTALRGDDFEKMRWDYSWSGGDRGAEACHAEGIYAGYGDGYFRAYIEAGMVERVSRPAFSSRGSSAGLLYGTSFRHPYFHFSMTGRESGENFYPLYSSGKDYPERSIFLDQSVRPLDALTAGASFSSSRRISPGIQDLSLPALKREALYLKYQPGRNSAMELKGARVRFESSDGQGNRRQGGAESRQVFFQFLETDAHGVIQQDESAGSSWMYGAGAGVRFFDYFHAGAGYSRYLISGKNYLYAKRDDDGEAVSGWSMETRAMNRVTGKIAMRYNRNHFFLRYENCYIGFRSLKKRFEFMGRIIF